MEARVRHLSAFVRRHSRLRKPVSAARCPPPPDVAAVDRHPCPPVSAPYRTAALQRESLSAVCPLLHHLLSRGQPVMCPPTLVPIRLNCCFVTVPALAAAALLVQDLPPVSLLFVALPSHGLSVPRRTGRQQVLQPPVPQHRRPLVFECRHCAASLKAMYRNLGGLPEDFKQMSAEETTKLPSLFR